MSHTQMPSDRSEPLTLDQIARYCIKFEEIVRPLGFHVGLTGSSLYGNGNKHDVDINHLPT